MVKENKVLLFNFSKKKFQKNINTFIITKDSSFCDQILQAVAFLDKTLKTFIFIFVNFNSCFLKNTFHFNISLGRAFPAIPIFFQIFKKLKWLEKSVQ